MPWHGLTAHASHSLIKSLHSSEPSNKNKLSPYWVTGFSDAESSFSIKIYKSAPAPQESSKHSLTFGGRGWSINPTFAIELHKKDIAILEEIKSFFGIGTVFIRKTRNNAVYHVQSVKELREVIIPHFNKYPLITQKKQILFYLVLLSNYYLKINILVLKVLIKL